MATYNIESFYRTTLQWTILASDTVASITANWGLKVFNVPTGTYSVGNPWFVTVSPNTDNEEIFEFTAVNSTTKVLTISKRGINKASTSLTTDGSYTATWDYNNTIYTRSHTINDAVRSDINHIHINQNFSAIELKSTANGKGASQVWIEDAGGYFTSTNMEGALQEALSVLAPNVKATASVYWVSKMSVAPVSASDPIAVSDNDTRVNLKYCIAYNSATQSITDNTWVTYNINTYETNDSSMSATTWRIIIPTTWQYIISWCIQFASNATWIREAIVTKNWIATTLSDITRSAFAGWPNSINFSFIVSLDSSDYILLRCFQNSTWALNITSWASNSYLSVAKL